MASSNGGDSFVFFGLITGFTTDFVLALIVVLRKPLLCQGWVAFSASFGSGGNPPFPVTTKVFDRVFVEQV